LADDAVRIEPVSGANSLLTGKITGNFFDFRAVGQGRGAYKPAASGPFQANSLIKGTGNFVDLSTELFPRNREFGISFLFPLLGVRTSF
jgi:hypothetical protein